MVLMCDLIFIVGLYFVAAVKIFYLRVAVVQFHIAGGCKPAQFQTHYSGQLC
jgi:hypothetical protein